MAKFLYKSIPSYSKEILDIFRDVRNVNGEVIETKPLEEYLDNIDTLTLESIGEYIRDIIKLTDIDIIPKEYLPYLGYLIGYVWDDNLDAEYQRYLLKSMVQLYKRKGTKFNIHYNISYLDPGVQITEPYKNIFHLNKSKLDSQDVFASDMYSWGVYIVKSSYNADVIRKIVDRTRPAGWRTIFDQISGSWSTIATRPRDELWDIITKSSWYTDVYREDLAEYIMWGSLTAYINGGNLLYEDPTGYRIRGNGKNILLPREFILNDINAISSKKRIFNGLDRTIFLQGFGDKGVYLGSSILYNSPINTGNIGFEDIYTTNPTPTQKNLFLGSSNSKTADPNIIINSATKANNGSIFKNFVMYDHNDWAKVGPLLPGVESAELGSKQWLEYDNKQVDAISTDSVYLGVKPILWSSTPAAFSYKPVEEGGTGPVKPYAYYGNYTFNDRDLDYYFWIHKAFSPKKYSRSIDYNCRLLDGLLPDDDNLVLTNYDDLPYKGTLVINNEFIEYEKTIDNSQWVKFYVDGVELKESDTTINSLVYKVDLTYIDTQYSFIIDTTSDAKLDVQVYRNNIELKIDEDYIVLDKTSRTIYLEDLRTNRAIRINAAERNPKDWVIMFYNAAIPFNIDVLSHIEETKFYIDQDYYISTIDKSESNICKISLVINSGTSIYTTIDTNEGKRNITTYIDDNVVTEPLDATLLINNYRIQYDAETTNFILHNYDTNKDIIIKLGHGGIRNDVHYTVDGVLLGDLSATALSDRIDINFTIDNKKRTLYGASDKQGVFQAFYYTGKTELVKNKDCKITIMPRTILIDDYELNKIIMVRYHNQPSIPIIRRFVSKLGVGETLVSKLAEKILEKFNTYTLETYSTERKLVQSEAEALSIAIIKALQVYYLPDRVVDKIAEEAVKYVKDTAGTDTLREDLMQIIKLENRSEKENGWILDVAMSTMVNTLETINAAYYDPFTSKSLTELMTEWPETIKEGLLNLEYPIEIFKETMYDIVSRMKLFISGSLDYNTIGILLKKRSKEFSVTIKELSDPNYKFNSDQILAEKAYDEDGLVSLEDLRQYKKGVRPRLLVRNDLIEYKYKLHQLHDMSLVQEQTITPKVIYMTEPYYDYLGNLHDDHLKIRQGRPDSDYNSVYVLSEVLNNDTLEMDKKWVYVSKLDEFLAKETSAKTINCVYSNINEYNAAIDNYYIRKANMGGMISNLSTSIYINSAKGKVALETYINTILAQNPEESTETIKYTLRNLTSNEELISDLEALANKIILSAQVSSLTYDQIDNIGKYVGSLLDNEANTFEDIFALFKLQIRSFALNSFRALPINNDTIYVRLNGEDGVFYNKIFRFVEADNIVEVGSLSDKDVVLREEVILDPKTNRYISAAREYLKYIEDYTVFMAACEEEYSIKNEYLSVSELLSYDINKMMDKEMENYLQVGDHVIIKSFGADPYTSRQVQMHNQNDMIYSTMTRTTDIYEFLGKQILPAYVHNVGKHLGTHLIDKKYIREGEQTNYSLNLGAVQKLSEFTTKNPLGKKLAKIRNSEERAKPVVLGGTGKQNNMAFNRSDLVYDKRIWLSIGAPVTDISGKSYAKESEAILNRFLLGERKPLGNKLYVEMTVKYNYKVDLELHKLYNNIQPRQEYKVLWDINVSLTPGINTPALYNAYSISEYYREPIKTEDGTYIKGNKSYKSTTINSLLLSLPINRVDNIKEADFKAGDSVNGRTGFSNIVLNSAGVKDHAISNINTIYTKFNWVGTDPVVSSGQIYKLGSRNLLGSTYFSKLPYSYYNMGIIKNTVSMKVYTNVYKLHISTILGTAGYVAADEPDLIYKFGGYRLSKTVYSVNDLRKEDKLYLDKTHIGILGGTSNDNVSTMLYKTKVRSQVSPRKVEPIILDIKGTTLGKRYLLGNKVYSYYHLLEGENIDLGVHSLNIFDKLYVNPIDIIVDSYAYPSIFIKEYDNAAITKYFGLTLNYSLKDTSVDSTKVGVSKLEESILGGVTSIVRDQLNMISPVFGKHNTLLLIPVAASYEHYKLGKKIPLGNGMHIIWEKYPKQLIDLGKQYIGISTHEVLSTALLLDISYATKLTQSLDLFNTIPVKYIGKYRFGYVKDEKYNEDNRILVGSVLNNAILGGVKHNGEFDVINDFTINSIYGVIPGIKKSSLGRKQALGNSLGVFFAEAKLKKLDLGKTSILGKLYFAPVTLQTSYYPDTRLIIKEYKEIKANKYFGITINPMLEDNNTKATKIGISKLEESILGGFSDYRKDNMNILSPAFGEHKTTLLVPVAPTFKEYKLGQKAHLGNSLRIIWEKYPRKLINLGKHFVGISKNRLFTETLLLNISSATNSLQNFNAYSTPIPLKYINKYRFAFNEDTMRLDEARIIAGASNNGILGGTALGSNFEVLNSFNKTSIYGLVSGDKRTKLGLKQLLGNAFGVYYTTNKIENFDLGKIELNILPNIYSNPLLKTTSSYSESRVFIKEYTTIKVSDYFGLTINPLAETPKNSSTKIGVSKLEESILGGFTASKDNQLKILTPAFGQHKTQVLIPLALSTKEYNLGKSIPLGNGMHIVWEKYPKQLIDLGRQYIKVEDTKALLSAMSLEITNITKSPKSLALHNIPIMLKCLGKYRIAQATDIQYEDDTKTILGNNKKTFILGGSNNIGEYEVPSDFTIISIYGVVIGDPKATLGKKIALGNNLGAA